MLCWGHYQFRQHLVAKVEELWVRVIIQNEAYTSKTCSCSKNRRVRDVQVPKWRSGNLPRALLDMEP